jgi:predicted acylesterase/phospholipase RssA
MADPNTRRILALDGGGAKGVFQAQFLSHFVNLWGINPNELWKHFDVICGTSVGGIQALYYATGGSPDDALDFMHDSSPAIFSTSTVVPGEQATILDKLSTMLLGGSFYPPDVLIATLNSFFGVQTMQDCKTNTLITSYNYDTDTPVLFSNNSFPDSQGENELLANVALATSAAPLYFPQANIGGVRYIDGAMIKNNPEWLGYALGQVVKPLANRTCVLSLGCGLGNVGFHDVPTPPPDESNMAFLFRTISIAINGGQETDAKQMDLVDNYSLDNLYAYRANAFFENPYNDLDLTTEEAFTYRTDKATEVFNGDISDISTFLGHLMA